MGGSVLPLCLGQHFFSRFFSRQHLYATGTFLSFVSATSGVLLLDGFLFLLAEFLKLHVESLPRLGLGGCALFSSLAVSSVSGSLAFNLSGNAPRPPPAAAWR